MGSMTMSDVYITAHTEQRLVAAAGAGDISTVRKLLRKNVSTKVLNKFGQTAIGAASLGGHTQIVQLLIEAGADVNQRTGSSVAPLHLASRNQHVSTVKQLILSDAALDLENINKITPIGLAPYNTETWNVLNDAKRGDMPEVEEESEVPEIPDYALPDGAVSKKKKKSGKKGKKGKKGKGKKGKKSGKKKKGGKKKGKKKKK